MRIEEMHPQLCEPQANGCVLWLGPVDRKGYGHVRYEGNQKKYRTHRFAWEVANGDPGKMHVLHTCDVTGCVRLEHLFLGTNAVNMRDKADKGRAGNRLTTDRANDIRALYAKGRHTQAEVADLFGVCQQTVSVVVNRKTWTNV